MSYICTISKFCKDLFILIIIVIEVGKTVRTSIQMESCQPTAFEAATIELKTRLSNIISSVNIVAITKSLHTTKKSCNIFE